jgi:hypothetical protein
MLSHVRNTRKHCEQHLTNHEKGNIMSISKRALHIKKTLGVRCAAGYIRNAGLPISVALHLLTRTRRHDA